MGGRACIRGLRITVAMALSLLAQGATAEDILNDDPDPQADDIRQSLPYAAWLAREAALLV